MAKEIIDKELFEYYDSIAVECEEIFEKEKESFFKKICVVTFPRSTVVKYYKPSNLRHDGELIYTYFEDDTGDKIHTQFNPRCFNYFIHGGQIFITYYEGNFMKLIDRDSNINLQQNT